MNPKGCLDFCDTLIDYPHLLSAFPSKKISLAPLSSSLVPSSSPPEERVEGGWEGLSRPFRVYFAKDGEVFYLSYFKSFYFCLLKKIKKQEIVVEPYLPPSPGPYPEDKPKQNAIPFTSSQVIIILTKNNITIDYLFFFILIFKPGESC